MKSILAGMTTILLAGLAFTQERIDPEDAQRKARVFVEQSARLEGLQIQVDPDPAQPYGLRKDDIGGMVIPDKKLSLNRLEKADKEIIPLGQFWVRKLTVIANNEPLAKDRLRVVEIKAGDQAFDLPLFLIGARKASSGDLELVVYAKDKEPVVRVPLRKVASNQEFPIQMTARGENERGIVTLQILGTYQADLTFAIQD